MNKLLISLMSPVMLAMIVVLSGCSNGGGSGGADNDDGAGNVPLPAADSFITEIRQIVSMNKDDAEPVDISDINLSEPDDTEPEFIDS